MTQICAITGAAGYLGSVIARTFLKRGWGVRALSRRRLSVDNPLYEAHSFDLGEALNPLALKGVSVLIHAAYDFQVFSQDKIHEKNIEGTLRLFEAARKASVSRILFISSISAFEGCASLYGSAKLSVEKRAADQLAGIVRPGLVYGPTRGGTFGRMAALAEKFPVLPLIGSGDQPLYLVHEEDAARVIFEMATSDKNFNEPVTVAHPRSHTFREVLEAPALKQGKKPAFIPVPFTPMLAALKLAELFGMQPRLRADSLVSLLNPNPHVDFSPLRRLGIDLRPYSAGTLE
jgi:nucleoside-diphosphate-sugar epimerase